MGLWGNSTNDLFSTYIIQSDDTEEEEEEEEHSLVVMLEDIC